jgi:adenylate kinase family enzyme
MIIFINGSINAGKSTIAKLLASKIPNTANVEIDSFHEFIYWLEIDKAVPINLENAVLVINNFAKRGYNVVVPYPLSQKNYEYLKKELCNNELYFFTLSPDIKKAQSNTNDRKLTQWERERIQHHYDIGIPNPDFGKIIDNTGQTPEETVEEIISLLPKNY